MRLRLEGTPAELEAAVAVLAAGFELREVSRPYPNRAPSVFSRVYIDAEPLASTSAQNPEARSS